MTLGLAPLGTVNQPHITGLPAASKAQVARRVQSCVPFDYNHTLYGDNIELRCGVAMYVVWSYGKHFPLAVTMTPDIENKFWYVNADPSTPTTGRHRGMVLDGVDGDAAQFVTTDELQTIINQATDAGPAMADALVALSRPVPDEAAYRIR